MFNPTDFPTEVKDFVLDNIGSFVIVMCNRDLLFRLRTSLESGAGSVTFLRSLHNLTIYLFYLYIRILVDIFIIYSGYRNAMVRCCMVRDAVMSPALPSPSTHSHRRRTFAGCGRMLVCR